MRKNLLSALALCLGIAGTASAQYGLLENFQGNDRNGNFVNLSEGANFTYGGASGGGEGFLATLGSNGFGWGTGAALSDGYGIQVNATAGVFDLTQTVNGLTSTGYTITIVNVDDCCGGTIGVNNGDVIDFIVEDDSVPVKQEIFQISTLVVGTPQTFNFTPGTGTPGPDGLADRTRFKQFIVRASNLGGSGNSNLHADNIGFTGNLVPTSYAIENFDAQTIGTAATAGAGGQLGNRNVFGGVVETFAFGAGAVTGATLASGAFSASFNGIEGGFFLNLGPQTGSQADISAQTELSIDLAVNEVGQQVRVILETPDAANYADRSYAIVSPTTTLATYTIPFSSLISGPQGFSASRIQRVTVVPEAADAGAAGITITADNVAFTGAASVSDWNLY